MGSGLSQHTGVRTLVPEGDYCQGGESSPWLRGWPCLTHLPPGKALLLGPGQHIQGDTGLCSKPPKRLRLFTSHLAAAQNKIQEALQKYRNVSYQRGEM